MVVVSLVAVARVVAVSESETSVVAISSSEAVAVTAAASEVDTTSMTDGTGVSSPVVGAAVESAEEAWGALGSGAGSFSSTSPPAMHWLNHSL